MTNIKTLILPIGIPGSGKTTWCKNFLSPYNISIVSSDSIREELYGNESIQGSFDKVFDIVYERAANILAEDGVVCVDATNVSKFARRQAIFTLRPKRIIYIIMNNNINRAKRQNQMRERHCPEYVIENMARKLKNEPPRKDTYNNIEIYNYNDLVLLDVLRELSPNV